MQELIVLKNKTSEEVFSAKKPEVSHLKIFGCPVYIHIPKDKRTKSYHNDGRLPSRLEHILLTVMRDFSTYI